MIGIPAERDRRAVGQVEVDPAPEVDGAGEEPAVRDEDAPAAGARAGGDSLAERGGAVARAVAHGAVVGHRKDAIREDRRQDPREDRVHLAPAAMRRLRGEPPARAAALEQAGRHDHAGACERAGGEEVPASHARVTHGGSWATSVTGRRRA